MLRRLVVSAGLLLIVVVSIAIIADSADRYEQLPTLNPPEPVIAEPYREREAEERQLIPWSETQTSVQIIAEDTRLGMVGASVALLATPRGESEAAWRETDYVDAAGRVVVLSVPATVDSAEVIRSGVTSVGGKWETWLPHSELSRVHVVRIVPLPGYAKTEQSFRLETGEYRNEFYVAPSLQPTAGQLVDHGSGAPPSSAMDLTFFDAADGSIYHSTSHDGRWNVVAAEGNLVPLLTSTHHNLVWPVTSIRAGTSDNTLRFETKPAVQLVDLHTGAPIQTASISIWSVDGTRRFGKWKSHSYDGLHRIGTASSSAIIEGSVVVLGVEAAGYSAVIQDEPWDTSATRIVRLARGDTSTLSITGLERGAHVRLGVLAASRDPGWTAARPYARGDAVATEGRIEWSGLIPGIYVVQVVKNGLSHRSWVGRVELDTSVDMGESCGARLALTWPEHVPRPSRCFLRGRIRHELRLDRGSGRLCSEWVGPGLYELCIHSPGGDVSAKSELVDEQASSRNGDQVLRVNLPTGETELALTWKASATTPVLFLDPDGQPVEGIIVQGAQQQTGPQGQVELADWDNLKWIYASREGIKLTYRLTSETKAARVLEWASSSRSVLVQLDGEDRSSLAAAPRLFADRAQVCQELVPHEQLPWTWECKVVGKGHGSVFADLPGGGRVYWDHVDFDVELVSLPVQRPSVQNWKMIQVRFVDVQARSLLDVEFGVPTATGRWVFGGGNHRISTGDVLTTTVPGDGIHVKVSRLMDERGGREWSLAGAALVDGVITLRL